MWFFKRKKAHKQELEVSGLHFSHSVGIRLADNAFPSASCVRHLGFITLSPHHEDVLAWISRLQGVIQSDQTPILVNLSEDIRRSFALAYDFADILVIDPDPAGGIGSPDVSDITSLLDDLLSLRLCYEKITPIYLRVPKVKSVVAGGNTRQISVYNGLKGVQEVGAQDDDIVIIHDSARPLISQKIIVDNINACKEFGAVDTVIKASDTIVHSENGETITDIPPRKELYQGQTPQTFKMSIIMKAHEAALNNEIPNVTDDTKLVLSLGMPVHLVEGDKLNFKITTFDDLMMLKALLKIGKSEVL